MMKIIFKIGFCALLIFALVYAVLGLHFGSNRLQAQFVQVKNSDCVEKMTLDWEKYAYMADGFPFTREEFYKEAIEPYDVYYGQRIQVTAVNKNKFDIRILALEILSGNGSGTIYVSCLPERVVTIPAGTKEPQSVWFPVISSGPANEEVLEKVRNNMQIKIIYVDAACDAQTLADADEALLHKEWIRK